MQSSASDISTSVLFAALSITCVPSLCRTSSTQTPRLLRSSVSSSSRRRVGRSSTSSLSSTFLCSSSACKRCERLAILVDWSISPNKFTPPFHVILQCTAFLLDVLASDKPEEGFLQTKLLEMNLQGGAPQVVNAILGSGMFHHFDKARIALLCEKYQLSQRALELYTDLKDIKRVLLVSAASLDPTFVMTYFGTLTAENGACAPCTLFLLMWFFCSYCMPPPRYFIVSARGSR
jgi:hypothetical protein